MIHYPKTKGKYSICIIAGIMLFVCSVWGAVAPLLIYALPPSLIKARTIAELIFTLFAGAGTPTVSPIVMPAIEASVGTEAYTFESLIEEGILQPVDSSLTTEEAVELLGTGNQLQQPFNLDADAWRTYVEGNWSQMQEYGVDAMLRLNEIANTDTVYGAIDNLGQLALDVGNYGFLGASNAISVLANPGTVVEVGFDNILQSIKDVYGNVIEKCLPMNYYDEGDSLNGLDIQGYLVKTYPYTNSNPQYLNFYGSNVRAVASFGNPNDVGGRLQKLGIAYLSGSGSGNWASTGNGTTINGTNGSNQIYTNVHSGTGYYKAGTFPHFVDEVDAINYLAEIRAGTIEEQKINPNFVTPTQGSLIKLDDVEPVVDAGKGIDLIPYEDYAPFAEQINDNLQNNDIEDNSVITDAFLTDYINEVQENPTIPDENPAWMNPEIPATNPIIPEKPVLPESPEISPEVQSEAMQAIPEGIEEIFPFCIPWDIYALIKGLEIGREAPHIVWTFESDLFGISYTFDIDLSEFDDVASVLRILELILFIIGLAVATRGLIGA